MTGVRVEAAPTRFAPFGDGPRDSIDSGGQLAPCVVVIRKRARIPQDIDQTLDVTVPRQVMVRTERVGATERRDAMLSEPEVQMEMQPQDLRQGVLVDQAASILKAPDAIEYW